MAQIIIFSKEVINDVDSFCPSLEVIGITKDDEQAKELVRSHIENTFWDDEEEADFYNNSVEDFLNSEDIEMIDDDYDFPSFIDHRPNNWVKYVYYSLNF
jgi:hypothetical protein